MNANTIYCLPSSCSIGLGEAREYTRHCVLCVAPIQQLFITQAIAAVHRLGFILCQSKIAGTAHIVYEGSTSDRILTYADRGTSFSALLRSYLEAACYSDLSSASPLIQTISLV